MCDYRQSHMTAEHASSYDGGFRKNPYLALLWELERRVLARILRTFFGGRTIRHLDFACGTGRILAWMEQRTEESVGVDLSPEMLRLARQRLRRARVIQADLTREDVLGDRKFDLITAFRFFPNAQRQLRRQALAVIVRHLEPTGYVVFNNHKNLSSIPALVARVRGRSLGKGMSRAEGADLVRQGGLRIVKRFGIGLVPWPKGYPLLPLPLLRAVEHAATALGLFNCLSQDLLYVCTQASRRGAAHDEEAIRQRLEELRYM